MQMLLIPIKIEIRSPLLHSLITFMVISIRNKVLFSSGIEKVFKHYCQLHRMDFHQQSAPDLFILQDRPFLFSERSRLLRFVSSLHLNQLQCHRNNLLGFFPEDRRVVIFDVHFQTVFVFLRYLDVLELELRDWVVDSHINQISNFLNVSFRLSWSR